MGNWQTISRERVYQNPWIEVLHHEVINPSGNRGIYGVVHFRHRAIGILALDAWQRILLVGQYRFPLDAYSWEIPEGGCPLAEDNLEAARRELREETGMEAASWEPICRYHLTNSVADEEGQLFLATGLTSGPPQPEETEELSHQRVSIDEALQLVESGGITDAISIIAIYKAALLRAEGKLPPISPEIRAG